MATRSFRQNVLGADTAMVVEPTWGEVSRMERAPRGGGGAGKYIKRTNASVEYCKVET